MVMWYRMMVSDGGPTDQLVVGSTRVVHERKVRREIANSNERKRMQSINAGFQSLRLLLPRTGPVDRLSKVALTTSSLSSFLLPRGAMLSAVYAVVVCLSVRLSICK